MAAVTNIQSSNNPKSLTNFLLNESNKYIEKAEILSEKKCTVKEENTKSQWRREEFTFFIISHSLSYLCSDYFSEAWIFNWIA